MHKWRPDRFDRLDRDWTDRPAILVGTGPSMKGFDFDRLRGLGHILAVKQSWRDLPFADACFGLDLPWMRTRFDELCGLAQRMPLWLCVPDMEFDHMPVPGAKYLRRVRDGDLMTTAQDTIECGGNSGFGALNFAFLRGAKRIVLFGFDFTGNHYCEDRYDRPVSENGRYWPRWATNFNHITGQLAAAGVDVINASPGSIVTAFPKVSHDEAFEHLDRLGSEGRGSLHRGAGVDPAPSVGLDPGTGALSQ